MISACLYVPYVVLYSPVLNFEITGMNSAKLSMVWTTKDEDGRGWLLKIRITLVLSLARRKQRILLPDSLRNFVMARGVNLARFMSALMDAVR